LSTNIEDLKITATKFALQNAVQHDGKARLETIIGRIIAEHPQIKPQIKTIIPIINKVLQEVNSWDPEKQKKILMEKWPNLYKKKKIREEKKTLPPLENVENWSIIKTRFAPNPDGALHLGSAEPIIFCDEYAKMHNGHFILRYEDTSTEVKPPLLEMYDAIIRDLEWLGVKIDEKYIQSDRLPIYYKYAKELLRKCKAYVCICERKKFRELYMNSSACPCRDLSNKYQLERWEKMLDGTYKKGEAVVRIKTDLNDPNPAVRDWPALRISDVEHPRQGNKYRVWPLYNFSCGLDDHLMGVSHIIRGKEHDVNTTRQRWLQKHLEWKFPEIINVGRLSLDAGILSKSKIRAGIEAGIYSGWEDPRLGTLSALRKRGLQPETIRDIMIQVGPKPINASISWENIAAINRKYVEWKADRYFFINDPSILIVTKVSKTLNAHLPLHPDDKQRGTRDYILTPKKGVIKLHISSDDLIKLKKDSMVRLMGLMNIKITNISQKEIRSIYHSDDHKIAREHEAPFLHWLPHKEDTIGQIIMPDATLVNGIIEKKCLELKEDQIIQFERFGFCRVDSLDPWVAYFSHH
jgi:glutamyl-tRNA synthetase